MTEEMYKRLNNYLNDIFMELNISSEIFVNNLLQFFKINNIVSNYDQRINNKYVENKLTFNDLYILAREIIEKINPNYLIQYDELLKNGELDFSFNNEYDDSHCTYTISKNKTIKLININRCFNYGDVITLIHEFIHYTNVPKKHSQTHEFFTEFISIYFELYAKKYLIENKNIPIDEIMINSRIISLFRQNNELYKYIVILLAYDKLGNINKNTIKDINNILRINDKYFEKECIQFLSKLDSINNTSSENNKTKNMANLINYHYKYIIGTILAYYAIENCKLEDMVKLNNNISSEQYSYLGVDDILENIGIYMSDENIEKSLTIIKNSIHNFEMEKTK